MYGQLVHQEQDHNGVTYSLFIEPEDSPLEGNVIESGDNVTDLLAEVDIAQRLNYGDEWAWFCARVEASFKSLRGIDMLGCCSYSGKDEFLADDGYWPDMKAQALANLIMAARDGVELMEVIGKKG